MAFSDAERTAIRRFCGYPVFGNEATQHFGYRYFNWYGTLEYRLNHLQVSEETVIRDTYLPRLAQLEADLVDQTRTNLDTDQAAVWKHNQREHKDRAALLDDLRRRLCGFLGVQPGPALAQANLWVVV